MCCKVGILLYTIVQFVAFLFVLVGTPIDMFRYKDKNLSSSVTGNTRCLTMWGEKEKCYSTTYDKRPSEYFSACSNRADRFRVAEAFAIISIGVFGVACLLGFIQLCCCTCFRWICLVLNIVGIATACIPWALMAYAYYNGDNSVTTQCEKLKETMNYGAGFALLVVGWCLNIVAIIFLMLPC